jgi:hypothetical protein
MLFSPDSSENPFCFAKTKRLKRIAGKSSKKNRTFADSKQDYEQYRCHSRKAQCGKIHFF